MLDDLAHALVFTRYDHSNPAGRVVFGSDRLIAQCDGTTTAAVLSTKFVTQVAKGKVPKDRLPANIQLNNANHYARRKKRLDDNEFKALLALAEKHPKDVFHISGVQELIETGKTTSMTFCMTNSNALRQIIQFGSIIYLDSSFRNKNSHHAPLTVLIVKPTMTKSVPGAAMISNKDTEECYFVFLKELKKTVEDEAKAWITEKDFPDQASDIASNGWKPTVALIDKSEAERNALRRVFPGIYCFRVCI